VANDQTDQPTIPQASAAGGSKDVLFGWLVGRAAADLGLAQALAASEAQRTEQFKALEAGLLAQIQELRDAPSALAGNSDQTDEFARLKAEMQSLLERMGGFEAAAQHFVQTPEILRDEMARLQAQLSERQGAAESHRAQLATTADALRARMDQWENRQAAKLETVDRAAGEITELNSTLEPLADRLARLEFAGQTVETRMAEEIARIEKLADERVQRELAALKSEMLARLEGLSDEALTRRFEHATQNRLGELPARLEQNARSLTRLAADHASLRSEMEDLSKRIGSAVAVPPVDLAAERERWSGAIDDRIAARLRDLGESIRRETGAIGESKADRDGVAAEFAGLAERLTRIEGAIESASASMEGELSSIKTELSRQQSQLQPAAALLQSLEETLRTEIGAIQDYLGREQQSARTRELQQREFEIQLQRVTQRLKETETMVQQTHALIVNEGTQAAQQREAVTAELATLRAQVGEPQGRAALDRLEESVRAKIHELQSQLAQNAAGLDRRDDELRDLKAQIENLAESAARSESRMAPLPFPLAERILETAPALDLAAEAPRENRPSATPGLAGLPREARPAAEVNGGWEPALTEGQDPLKLLHERMSADIERARAELREKSGRWKLRR
jgi:chromosome segregation ATPase